MNAVARFHDDRQMIESALAILDTLIGRLNTGEPLPNGSIRFARNV
jgi:hypothetical protein